MLSTNLSEPHATNDFARAAQSIDRLIQSTKSTPQRPVATRANTQPTTSTPSLSPFVLSPSSSSSSLASSVSTSSFSRHTSFVSNRSSCLELSTSPSLNSSHPNEFERHRCIDQGLNRHSQHHPSIQILRDALYSFSSDYYPSRQPHHHLTPTRKSIDTVHALVSVFRKTRDAGLERLPGFVEALECVECVSWSACGDVTQLAVAAELEETINYIKFHSRPSRTQNPLLPLLMCLYNGIKKRTAVDFDSILVLAVKVRALKNPECTIHVDSIWGLESIVESLESAAWKCLEVGIANCCVSLESIAEKPFQGIDRSDDGPAKILGDNVQVTRKRGGKRGSNSKVVVVSSNRTSRDPSPAIGIKSNV
ncbi:hypothetical protein BCR33DRAFT_855077 [Rhizoclosmatium globosum]|uniref:Uncharacterized protein n=1 Tax=Rhizoclosmatium globosum TaxID=329046 RepID=A0A1Y2BPE3_9FUNG|nr:hypothetical protein BCR33DRAFT_855077 [Rhizoclosmatium globosum]|eukprot:ORY36621.1 hypothetical protein BCR33DRAFT_855077 [Rhizoclosmatium globosum]